MSALIRISQVRSSRTVVIDENAPAKHLGPYVDEKAAEEALESHGWRYVGKGEWHAVKALPESQPYNRAEIINVPDEVHSPTELPAV